MTLNNLLRAYIFNSLEQRLYSENRCHYLSLVLKLKSAAFFTFKQKISFKTNNQILSVLMVVRFCTNYKGFFSCEATI